MRRSLSGVSDLVGLPDEFLGAAAVDGLEYTLGTTSVRTFISQFCPGLALTLAVGQV